MDPLVTAAIEAHGGADRWTRVAAIRARLRFGGAAFLLKCRWPSGAPVVAEVSTLEQRVVFVAEGRPGRGVYTPGRVWFEDSAGDVVASRREPRVEIRSPRRALWWDRLDQLYFTGYALWSYLTAPFHWRWPNVEAREIEPWTEGGERWRRLEVWYPSNVAAHCHRQTYYLDSGTLIRRLDYDPEVFASWARAAQYLYRPRQFDGLIFPTARRVVPRDAEGRARSGPTLVWIEIDDLELRPR